MCGLKRVTGHWPSGGYRLCALRAPDPIPKQTTCTSVTPNFKDGSVKMFIAPNHYTTKPPNHYKWTSTSG